MLCFLHELSEDARKVLEIKPRGLLRHGFELEDLPTLGVFASDSPARPNPIGVSVVEFVGREARFLRVRGLDVFDGTPVLDIKPYTPDRSVGDVVTPEWYADLIRRSGSDRV